MIHPTLQKLAVPVDGLKPYHRNPRQGDIGAIVQSLEHHGQYRPIVVNSRTQEVLAGNHTLAAARELGWQEIAATFVDVDEDQAARIVLVDNRANDLATYDADALTDLLKELALEEEGLSGTGFDGDDLDDMLAELGAEPGGKGKDTSPAAPARSSSTLPGSIFTLGDHRLLCGDATNEADVALLGANRAAACLTDPPYGIDFDYAQHDDSHAQNAQLVQAVFDLAPSLRVWTPGKMNLARELAWNPDAKIACWHKGFAAAGNGLGGASTWEPVLIVGASSHADLSNDYINIPTDRDPALTDEDGLKHPCPKPVALYELLLEAFTAFGDAVYEPFAGSGTTLIACENLGRRCFAMEIDPVYCDVIVDRWERLTGRTAELEARDQ